MLRERVSISTLVSPLSSKVGLYFRLRMRLRPLCSCILFVATKISPVAETEETPAETIKEEGDELAFLRKVGILLGQHIA